MITDIDFQKGTDTVLMATTYHGCIIGLSYGMGNDELPSAGMGKVVWVIMNRIVPVMAPTSALPQMQDRGAFMSINSSL